MCIGTILDFLDVIDRCLNYSPRYSSRIQRMIKVILLIDRPVLGMANQLPVSHRPHVLARDAPRANPCVKVRPVDTYFIRAHNRPRDLACIEPLVCLKARADVALYELVPPSFSPSPLLGG